ncbi:UDP-glucuronosyl/UDP-glucosyltransferase [Parasponia andersonii]|uniref:Glycosyltransferase n=1 Tax=Parasponia andersonii TaxID=3476 RepID=A0A2P5BD35_PARAD|nr:UDP-glucuronosyl/UDP-glucosyltransferase [Parasponia andersonii]
MMENEAGRIVHVLALPYPSQGHVNPMLNFCKRLASKGGVKTTFATTVFISKTMKPQPSASVQLDTISDGFDEGGFTHAKSVADYLERLEAFGSKTLAELISRHNNNSPHPIDCIVYDAFLPWALDVAKQFGIAGAAFFTQACTVNYIYYCVHHRLMTVPFSTDSFPIQVEGLECLEQLRDMPSFIGVVGSYPAYFEMVLTQFCNADKADFVLVNTVYELEEKVVDSMSKVCPLLTIGPTIPSIYLDNRIKDDIDYGLNLFTSDHTSVTINNWLNSKPRGSVVFVSFGSMANLSVKQMEELALGFKATNFNFLWVVRETEEAKLPPKLAKEAGEKGLIVKWGPQVEILSHPAIGCFFTHCGWNSTIEALSLAVPMVGMPQWTDQPTDAKLVEDLWKVGVRVKVDDESGIVGRDEIELRIREVMDGKRSTEMRNNAKKWRNVALQAICEGGSSDKNIDEFVSKLKAFSSSK